MLNQEGPYAEKRSNPLFQRLRTLGKGVGGIPGKQITIYTAKGRAVETVPQQNFFLFVPFRGVGAHKTLPGMSSSPLYRAQRQPSLHFTRVLDLVSLQEHRRLSPGS